MTNLPVLRDLALERLKTAGWEPLTDKEKYYAAWKLRRSIGPAEAGLIEALKMDLDVLDLGRWEFVIGWLSPYHLASSQPGALAEIGKVLLGLMQVPKEAEDAYEKWRESVCR